MSNREIKFRIWLSDDKIFRYCDYIPTMGFVWTISGIPLEIGELYPQQFTGWQDKNGRLIYEGDILKCIKRTHNKYVEVTYDTYLASFVFEGRHIPEFLMLNEIEMVGNIFENPELLKEKNEKDN